MKRFLAAAAALPLAFLLLVPAVMAAGPALPHDGRVIISTAGDVTIPAGEHADAVIVINGTATIGGEVNTVIAVDGEAVLTGARAETIVAVRSPVTLGDGTVVSGDVMQFDSAVHKLGSADVAGATRDISADLIGLGFVLAPIFVLLFVGFAIAAVAAALIVAALAARQVRAAEAIITREPVAAFGVGLLGAFLPMALIVVLFVTIVGAPIALALLFGVWPLVAFFGYLVTGIWIGDWLLARVAGREPGERPYLAAVVGLLVLVVLGIWPFLPMIAGLFGYGAVLILAWRTFRGPLPGDRLVGRGAAMPMAT